MKRIMGIPGKIGLLILLILMIGVIAILIVSQNRVVTMSAVERAQATVGSYPIVDTGQNTFWNSGGEEIAAPVEGDAFYGQDAQYSGVQPSYTRSGDGLTVTDDVTGLTWQQSYDSGIYYWAETQTLVDNLNKQNYAGYNDWRLPTIKELYSLWNGSTGWPYIDTNYFSINYSSEEELSHAIFWSSDKYTGVLGNISGDTPGAELAFGVNFGTGHIKAYNINAGPRHSVRFVRGNLAYGVNLFQNNGDGTISDFATDLMWQKTDGSMHWRTPKPRIRQTIWVTTIGVCQI
jgi:hypothetical protein